MEFDPEELENLSKDSSDASTTSAGSTAKLTQQIGTSTEAAAEASLKLQTSILNGDTPISSINDPALEQVKEKLEVQKDSTVTIINKYEITFKYDDTATPKANFDPAKVNPDGFFGKIAKVFKDKFGDSKESLQKAADDAQKESEKSTGAKKESSKTLAIVLGTLLSGGLTAAGILIALWFAAQAKSGCYRYEPGKGQEAVKIDCDSTAIDATICNCTGDWKTLIAACTATDFTTQTCAGKTDGDHDWVYVYRHFTIFDMINDIIQEVGNIENKAASSVSTILDFLAK